MNSFKDFDTTSNIKKHWSSVELSRILHDKVGNQLAFIKLGLDYVGARLMPTNIEESKKELRELIQELNLLYEETRAIAQGLALADVTTVSEIITYTKKICVHTNILLEVQLNDVKSSPEHIQRGVFSTVYHRDLLISIQEILLNVQKHSAATKVSLIISQEEENLSVQIYNNGNPIDIGLDHSTGIGLKNIRHRMTRMGGSFEISNTQKPNGVIAKLLVPLGIKKE